MGAADWAAVGVGIMSVIFGLIGYLLSNKDAAQAKEISDLREKHELNSTEITNMKIEMVSRVHQNEWKDVTRRIFEKFEALNDALHSKEDKK
jgi:hypothetical protein